VNNTSRFKTDNPLTFGLSMLAGIGMILMIIALAFGVVLGTEADPNAMGAMFVLGLVLLICGIIAWYAATRPDTHFDDIMVPAESDHGHGHADHAHDDHAHDDHGHAEAHALPATTEAEAAPAPVMRTFTSSAPDDLTKIEGIGPKMSQALIAGGLETFAKVAAASDDQLKAAIESGGLRFAPSLVTWAQQAALAAAGDWAGLARMQESLTAGRKA
jgi:predicted flap endonuclease-1-like 5' DNA nuclease